MVEIIEGGATTWLLVQDKPECFDDCRLAGVILPKQDVHARGEVDDLIAKTSVVLDVDRSQVHDIPQDIIMSLGPEMAVSQITPAT
jgi:hypothetical protein